MMSVSQDCVVSYVWIINCKVFGGKQSWVNTVTVKYPRICKEGVEGNIILPTWVCLCPR